MKTILMSTDRWMDKENVLQIYNGTLLSHKKNKKQTHRHWEQTCGCQGFGEREGWTGSVGLADENRHVWNGLTARSHSTGNYIQYSVINHNGKEYKNNAYVCVTESVCWTAELIQHCRSTMLQFKKEQFFFWCLLDELIQISHKS